MIRRQLRRLLWPCMSVLLVVSLGCGDKKDPAPATEGSNPPAAGTGDGAGNPAATQPGPGGADQGVAEGQEIATPEELARRSFEAFTSKDRDSARNLTMAGLTVDRMEDIIRALKEAGREGPERDKGKSVSEIANGELTRMQERFDDAYKRLQNRVEAEGLDISQTKLVKIDVERPSAEEAARMREKGLVFEFADVTVIVELGGEQQRLRVDDCMKLPGIGWRADRCPKLLPSEATVKAAGRSEEESATAESAAPPGTRRADGGNTAEAVTDSDGGRPVSAAAAPMNAPIGFEVGNQAPEIIGEDVDGKKFKLSDYRGKVVLLDFWGDW